MFHVGRQHLERAFRAHWRHGTAAIPDDSHLLLILYAVECGLKVLLLQQRGLHSTERLDDDDLTHDLNKLLQRLGMRQHFVTCPAEPGTISIGAERFHEVLRYGGRLEPGKRAQILALATGILEEIRENL